MCAAHTHPDTQRSGYNEICYNINFIIPTYPFYLKVFPVHVYFNEYKIHYYHVHQMEMMLVMLYEIKSTTS